MRTIRTFSTIGTAALLFASVITVAGTRTHAQMVPGPHPAYQHALSDLRMARALLSKHVPNEAELHEEHVAISEINGAIAEIKKASIDDGKDVNYNPPVDAQTERGARLHSAERLLGKVHQDLSGAEDVPQSRGLKDRALMHVDAAWHATQDAISAKAH